MTKYLKVDEEAWKELTKSDVVNILREHLLEEKATALRKLISEENFKLPSWAEHQSFLLGDLKRIERILNFLPDKGK